DAEEVKGFIGSESEFGKEAVRNSALETEPKLDKEAGLLKVRRHLISNGYIDSQTAIEKYNVTRLSACIFKLRKRGMKIKTVPNAVRNKRTGEKVLCRYELT